jgi:predicted PurR-regulated permease PerM
MKVYKKIAQNKVRKKRKKCEVEHKISERKKHKSLAIWGFFVLLAALLLSQLAGVVIANIVIGLFSVLLPIFLAITLAYLFKKLVTLVEVKLFHKLFTKHKKALQYRRIVSLSIVFALFLLLIVVFLLLFIPLFLNRITDLVNNSDSYISKVINELTQFFSNITLLQQFQLQDKVSELIKIIFLHY